MREGGHMNEIWSMRFLIVDDMFMMRKIMKNALSSFGAESVVEAKDGKVAGDLMRLEAANGKPFHFVISDWNMPEVTGLDLLKHCRAIEVLKNVGFVLVTAEADRAQEEVAKKAGVDAYVLKPIEGAQFREILYSVYRKRFGKK
jgi:two-component system, chemotaxis family, chemotaxis protein CheY